MDIRPLRKIILPASCRIFAALFRKIYDLLRRRIGRVWYTLPSRFAQNSSQIYDNLPSNTQFKENTYTGTPLFTALCGNCDPTPVPLLSRPRFVRYDVSLRLQTWRECAKIVCKSAPSMLFVTTRYAVNIRLIQRKFNNNAATAWCLAERNSTKQSIAKSPRSQFLCRLS